MSTVDKSIADRIIAGEFEEDHAFKIVKYKNAFDGSDAYGVVFEGNDPNRYKASEYVIAPELYWERPKDANGNYIYGSEAE